MTVRRAVCVGDWVPTFVTRFCDVLGTGAGEVSVMSQLCSFFTDYDAVRTEDDDDTVMHW